jgi:hypothetical protein
MHYYINNGVPERRERLDKHLKERGIFDNFQVHWVTEFPKDDPFAEWIHDFHAEHVSHGGLSGFVKLCEIFKMGLETGDSHFMISDDDVVFIKDWKKHFDSLNLGFINIISLGVNFHLLPDGITKLTGNVGGMECIIVSKEFATFFINNIDFRQATDIVISGIMIHHNVPLAITPICQQTSFLENKSTLDHSLTKYEKDWVTFVKTYRPSGLKYSDMIHDFTVYSQMRDVVENDFEKCFGIRIPIYNKRYIIERFKALSHV